jgi:hypothetical protein
MAFKGRDPVRSKIAIEDKIIEQVNSLNCLGNLISYEREVDTDSKLNKYLKITGVINYMLDHRKKNTTVQHTTLSSSVTP